MLLVNGFWSYAKFTVFKRKYVGRVKIYTKRIVRCSITSLEGNRTNSH